MRAMVAIINRLPLVAECTFRCPVEFDFNPFAPQGEREPSVPDDEDVAESDQPPPWVVTAARQAPKPPTRQQLIQSRKLVKKRVKKAKRPGLDLAAPDERVSTVLKMLLRQ